MNHKDIFRKLERSVRWSLLRHPAQNMAQTLRALADRVNATADPDYYGSGALIESFEEEMAQLFGKKAALFLPSGTLAQPLALRIYADRNANNRVALHSTSHLLLHEQNGYRTLWGLEAIELGDADRVVTLADLQELEATGDGLPAALLLELPMREIGGQLPDWEDLSAQVAWARARNIQVHFDGARIWQCSHAYQRSLAEVAALADSLYVSFYKDIGGIAGAMLLADESLISEARVWSRRAGGNLYSLYPYILAAQQGLDDNLASIEKAVDYAAQLAPLLAEIPAVQVNPATPQTAMFHLHIEMEPRQLTERIIAYARQHDVLILPQPRAVQNGNAVCEIAVGRNALSQPPEFWRDHLKACL